MIIGDLKKLLNLTFSQTAIMSEYLLRCDPVPKNISQQFNTRIQDHINPSEGDGYVSCEAPNGEVERLKKVDGDRCKVSDTYTEEFGESGKKILFGITHYQCGERPLTLIENVYNHSDHPSQSSFVLFGGESRVRNALYAKPRGALTLFHAD